MKQEQKEKLSECSICFASVSLTIVNFSKNQLGFTTVQSLVTVRYTVLFTQVTENKARSHLNNNKMF